MHDEFTCPAAVSLIVPHRVGSWMWDPSNQKWWFVKRDGSLRIPNQVRPLTERVLAEIIEKRMLKKIGQQFLWGEISEAKAREFIGLRGIIKLLDKTV